MRQEVKLGYTCAMLWAICGHLGYLNWTPTYI